MHEVFERMIFLQSIVLSNLDDQLSSSILEEIRIKPGPNIGIHSHEGSYQYPYNKTSTPGIVKLWESPGRAGGVREGICGQSPLFNLLEPKVMWHLTALPLRETSDSASKLTT